MYPMTSEPASRYFFKLLSEFKTELEKYAGVCVGGGGRERQDSNKPLACRHQSQQGHLTPFCKQDQQDKQLVENISLSCGWPDPLSQIKPQLSLDLYDESYF